ncbi:molybdopterin cofactor-binding domain-containing protein [Paracoccus sp. S1E-3]|uniref:xanthine dehydrogenase family protein molybdopterin-binding subunit n=1 Tax=Paracoccus sp. S1E-3 TaxID=2756130 RepID=UPI0015EF5964|nr:molybdopterin cofactor-binding domain-containing protein [Paracoccus sp. S1E-3]MBA4489837.1 xanthine dehydrogenase family protein molybdopterin-binding subunit [Paracoccus sp. S1E-3]
MSGRPETAKPFDLSRRQVIAGAGGLIVGYTFLPAFAQVAAPEAPAPEPAHLPGSLDDTRLLDAWIHIAPDDAITAFSGKAELGQSIKVPLKQIAAEELGIGIDQLTLVNADTGRTPDEGFTAGSMTIQYSGTALRNAAAQVRVLLIAAAARRWGIAPDGLRAENRQIIAPDGRTLRFGELVAETDLHVEALPESPLTDPANFRLIGQSLPRPDIALKATGGAAFIQDLRPEGMVHARVIRPASPGATLIEADIAAAEAMPGVVAVIRDGSFLAVVAEREFQAIGAMRVLQASANWQDGPALPDQTAMSAWLEANVSETGTVAEEGDPDAAEGETYEAVFTRPYLMHGSIGPSCALAVLERDDMTVWSHTQGVFADRDAIAELLNMDPARVRVIHAEGAGCYGHNGADDAAADAALIASKLPGRPIRLVWMREQEHANEPYGPPMLLKLRAKLGDGGMISAWSYDLYSSTHTGRPGGPPALLAGQMKADPYPPFVGKLSIVPTGNGDRNANPYYTIPNRRILWNFIEAAPLRISSLRALGAFANVFAVESAMDELALMAGTDPVEFRLRHLEDPRARDVVERAATEFGWSGIGEPGGTRGVGFAYARYKNLASYLALAVEIEVDPAVGDVRLVRAVAAIDAGEAVSPDGIINQTEGGILQSMSWTLFETVTFDQGGITSTDWSSYPILRFSHVPDSVAVHVIDRPGQPYLGAGEAAQGPTCGAIGNALRNTIGRRVHDLPLSRERVRHALQA